MESPLFSYMPYNTSTDGLLTVPWMVFSSQPEHSFNAAANWAFLFWKQSGTLTLNAFRLPVGGVAGSLTNILNWQLRNSDISGGVGTLITSGNATPASYTSLNITGLSQSLTDGQYYGLLIRNVDGTPASNSFNLLDPHTQPARVGFGANHSYDSGVTWNDEWGFEPNLQLSFSNGSIAGKNYMRSTNGFITTALLYSTSGSRLALAGYRFKPDGRFFLHRVNAGTRLVGTLASAGILVARLYRGTKLVATSNARQGSSSTGGNSYQSWYFTSPPLLEPDADYVVALGQRDTTGGDASNYWFPLGSTYAGYTRTGTTDPNNFWGGHTVYSTSSPLTAWTISADQMTMSLGVSPAVRA